MRVIIRRKHLILLFCLAATLTSLALTYVVSEEYQSYTTLLYPAPQMGLGAQASPYYTVQSVPSESIAGMLETVASSESVVQQVVRILELDKRPGDPQAALLGDLERVLSPSRSSLPDRFRQTVRGLQDRLSVEPDREALSFRLQALDRDPGQATAIVDTVARVLIDHLKQEQVRSTQQEREKIEVRLKENLEEITEARVELERFKKKSRISSLSEEISSKIRSLSEYEVELTKMRNELVAIEKMRDELGLQNPDEETGSAVQRQAEIGALKASTGALREKIGQERKDLRELIKNEARISELNLRLEVSERFYKLLNDAYGEARLAESAGVRELRILHPAVVPSTPARPMRSLYVGLTALVSLILGISYAFLVNFFDPSLRSVEQVEQVLKLPVLATVPVMRRGRN